MHLLWRLPARSRGNHPSRFKDLGERAPLSVWYGFPLIRGVDLPAIGASGELIIPGLLPPNFQPG